MSDPDDQSVRTTPARLLFPTGTGAGEGSPRRSPRIRAQREDREFEEKKRRMRERIREVGRQAVQRRKARPKEGSKDSVGVPRAVEVDTPPSVDKRLLAGMENALTSGNIGMNKTLINVNGKVAPIITNDNSRITYILKDAIKLNIGDRVTLYQAFLNEAGLNQDTITFDEDIEEELVFLYYVQSDNVTPFVGAPPVDDVVLQYQEYFNYPDQANIFYNFQSASTDTQSLSVILGKSDASAVDDPSDPAKSIPTTNVGYTNSTAGPNGQIMYCMANYNSAYDQAQTERYVNHPNFKAGDGYVEPIYGSATIKIKAGNYGVDAIADLITEQLLGATNDKGKNFITDRFYNMSGDNSVGIGGNNVLPASNKNIFKTKNSFNTEIFMPNEVFSKNSAYTKGQGNCGKKRSVVINNCQNDTRNTADDAINDDAAFIKDGLANCLGDFMTNTLGLELWEKCLTTSNIAPSYKDFVSNGLRMDGGIPTDRVQARPATRPEVLSTVCQYQALPKQYEAIDFAIGDVAPKKFVGTSAFNMTYSSSKANRFAINNLHEPCKMPTVMSDGSQSSFSGEQCTNFNYYTQASIRTGAGTDDNPQLEAALMNIAPVFQTYPVEARGGVMICNFSLATSKDTTKYKALKQTYDDNLANHGRFDPRTIHSLYKLNTAKYDELFDNETEAKTAWSKSIWSRLGFSYNQLGDITNQVEEVLTIADNNNDMADNNVDRVQKLKGIITHNAHDFSDIVASGNLGGLAVKKEGGTSAAGEGAQTNINMYSGLTYNNGNPNQFVVVGQKNNQINYGFGSGSQFSILCDSQPLDAETLPNLNNGNSYYLIHSDVVKSNFRDALGDKGTLVGIMTKQMSSNDTVYSVQGVEFIVTEEKLLNQININITNPDGTPVSDSILGPNSGFIFMVEQPIEPAAMENIEF